MKDKSFAKGQLVRYTMVLLSRVLVILALTGNPATGGENPIHNTIPVEDTVTLVDLGAKTCIPCKLMAPILAELQEEYKGRAEVVFIDVREDPRQGERFKIRSIPTQIFYDRQGKEVHRHSGFLSKKEIKGWLDRLITKKK